jgi:hypothetical protein
MGSPLSSRSITTTKTGGRIYINMPNGLGGWLTKQIDVTNLLAGVGSNALKLYNQTLGFSQAIGANSMVTGLFFTIVSGTPSVAVGTTVGGTDILESTLITGDMSVAIQQYFAANGYIYFTSSGGNVDVRIDLISDFK